VPPGTTTAAGPGSASAQASGRAKHVGDRRTRRRIIDGLQDLQVHLLEHLDYEERQAGPTMRRIDHVSKRMTRIELGYFLEPDATDPAI
jgi:hypothetical protein